MTNLPVNNVRYYLDFSACHVSHQRSNCSPRDSVLIKFSAVLHLNINWLSPVSKLGHRSSLVKAGWDCISARKPDLKKKK